MLVLARDHGHEPAAVVDPSLTGRDWLGLPAIASDENAIASSGCGRAILAIDSPEQRKHAFERYSAAGIEIMSLLATTPGEATVYGPGLTLQRSSFLSVDCAVGRAVRLNVGASVFHDCKVGDFVTVAPFAVVLGRVTIGAETYVGANATVLQDVVVGRNCMIGAGAVVTNDVADGAVVKGNPAR
jgi:sugar O-acyltransferase (sialic acid O-acetyltransferase NeuD family)